MADNDTDHFLNVHINKSLFSGILAGIGVAAFLIHCIIIGCRQRQRYSQGVGAQRPQSQEHQHPLSRHGGTTLELASVGDSTVAQVIPAHKYQKSKGLVGDDDGMCPVCLSQFEEGEDLRTLPECHHSYHVPCIDMWLYSHSSCPMCRSDALPVPV